MPKSRPKDGDDLFHAIVEHLPEMVFVKDAKDLRFLHANAATEDLLGIPREELIGKTDYDFFPRDEADFFRAKDREVIESGELVEVDEEKVQTRTRGERYLHTKKIPIFDRERNPIYLVGISRDITTDRELDEKMARLTLQLVEANQRLKDLATHDDLTGLKNARAFREQFEQELRRSRRNKTPLSLIMLDIDRFKKVNDDHGHLVGDSVLSGVAAFVAHSVRDIDTAARYGGEEIVVLLPGIELAQAVIVAERLRVGIAELSFAISTGAISITASFGVTDTSITLPAAHDLLQSVDDAMYQAKRSGRNRVVAATR